MEHYVSGFLNGMALQYESRLVVVTKLFGLSMRGCKIFVYCNIYGVPVMNLTLLTRH